MVNGKKRSIASSAMQHVHESRATTHLRSREQATSTRPAVLRCLKAPPPHPQSVSESNGVSTQRPWPTERNLATPGSPSAKRPSARVADGRRKKPKKSRASALLRPSLMCTRLVECVDEAMRHHV